MSNVLSQNLFRNVEKWPEMTQDVQKYLEMSKNFEKYPNSNDF